MEKHYFKRNGIKRLKADDKYKEVKMLCCYCDLKDECTRRERKESYEKAGWVTRCPFTPNGRKKKKK